VALELGIVTVDCADPQGLAGFSVLADPEGNLFCVGQGGH
jgi:hypothetical protein